MKKYIICIVLFFSTITFVDFIYGKIIGYMIKHAQGGEIKQLVDLCEQDQYDVLIMGSSKAHHNYVPEIIIDSLALSCYNAGYDGNGVILAYSILSLVDEERLPKLVVYDVKQQFDIYHFDGDGDYTRYYQKLKFFYDKPSVIEIIGSISKYDVIKLHSSLYRTNGYLFKIVSGFLTEPKLDTNYGYQPLLGTLQGENELEKDYINQVDSLKIEYFKRFINLTKKKGIELFVVFSPEYKTLSNNDFQPIIDICNDNAIMVFDYFEEPIFQKKEYFRDHCHLNEAGAKQFSSTIASDFIKKSRHIEIK